METVQFTVLTETNDISFLFVELGDTMLRPKHGIIGEDRQKDKLFERRPVSDFILP